MVLTPYVKVSQFSVRFVTRVEAPIVLVRVELPTSLWPIVPTFTALAVPVACPLGKAPKLKRGANAPPYSNCSIW